MHRQKKKKIEKKVLHRRSRNAQKEKKRKRKESVGAQALRITKLATYKEVCCTEAQSVEDPSNRYHRRRK